MKRLVYFLFLFLFLSISHVTLAQKWVDTVYSVKVERNLPYGNAIAFSGKNETLLLDVAYPTNDTPPVCGRPLVLIIHGGAWLGGSKDDAEVQRLMIDFAKRGYVAASINYRKGAFYPSTFRNCNISNLGVEWNCVNLQDTSEWIRAYYRAVQDAKGALRYMVNRFELYNLNPMNSYVCGFSAGGYTALGAVFLDHPSEWHPVADSIAPASRPAANYDNGCAAKYGWDVKAADMDLNRPNLGPYHGSLHYPADVPFKVQAVGNLYGGMFYSLLDSSSYMDDPAIYGFHQPNDLIVPYKGGRRVFDGYSACVYGLCGRGIQNRVVSYSSSSIYQWTKDLDQSGKKAPEMWFDSTKNNTDCAGQIANPSKGGHQLDNYWTRTTNMASYFAEQYDTSCSNSSIRTGLNIWHPEIHIYPNPGASFLKVQAESPLAKIQVFDAEGQLVLEKETNSKELQLDTEGLPSNVYVLRIVHVGGAVGYKKWMKQ